MPKEFECIECMKKYTSYNSLWNHNKKYHVLNNEFKNIGKNEVSCKYCKRYYTNKYTLYKHEIKCDYKSILIFNNIITDDLTKLKLEL